MSLEGHHVKPRAVLTDGVSVNMHMCLSHFRPAFMTCRWNY
jgi:hypothetical protein